MTEVNKETLRQFLHKYIDRAVDSDTAIMDITRGVERDYEKEEASSANAEYWKPTSTWKLILDWREDV